MKSPCSSLASFDHVFSLYPLILLPPDLSSITYHLHPITITITTPRLLISQTKHINGTPGNEIRAADTHSSTPDSTSDGELVLQLLLPGSGENKVQTGPSSAQTGSITLVFGVEEVEVGGEEEDWGEEHG